jgi:hypothetical protein
VVNHNAAFEVARQILESKTEQPIKTFIQNQMAVKPSLFDIKLISQLTFWDKTAKIHCTMDNDYVGVDLNQTFGEQNPTMNGGVELVPQGAAVPVNIAPRISSTPQTDAAKAKALLQEQRMLRAKATVESILEHWAVITLMSIYTIWALFNDDIRLSGTDKDADLGFTIVISIGFFLFVIEIMAQVFCKPDYFLVPKWERGDNEDFWEMWWRRAQVGSFYFWMDVIATLSLVLEVTSSRQIIIYPLTF